MEEEKRKGEEGSEMSGEVRKIIEELEIEEGIEKGFKTE